MKIVSSDKLPAALGQLSHQADKEALGRLEIVVVWRRKGELANHLGGAVHSPIHKFVAIAHPPRISFHLPTPTRGGDGHVCGYGIGPPA